MIARPPAVKAPATQYGIITADEFNLWCALNGQPFNLVANPRPRSSGAKQFAVARNGRNVRTIHLPRS